MINSFVNYLFGVNHADKFRLRLIKETGSHRHHGRPDTAPKTGQVVGYLFDNVPALNSSDWLLIVDTPGFGSSGGLHKDEQTVDELKRFFGNEINHISAVCFVQKATDTHLSLTQRWFYEQVLSMFSSTENGAVAEEEIASLLFTHCDAEDPPALKVIQSTGVVRYNQWFKLNNSGFVLKEDSTSTADTNSIVETEPSSLRINRTLNAMFWDMGMESFESLADVIMCSREKGFSDSERIKTVSGRSELAQSVEYAWREVEDGICKLISLEQAIPLIVQARSRIDTNTFEVETTKYLRVKKKGPSKYNIVCDACQCTCYEDSGLLLDGTEKGEFSHVELGGFYCTKCPRKCHWSHHRHSENGWDLMQYSVLRKIKEIKARYVKQSSNKVELEQILDGLRKEFHKTQKEVHDLVWQLQQSIHELEEVTLPPEKFLSEYVALMKDKNDVCDKKKVWKWRKGIIDAGARYLDNSESFDSKINRLLAQANIRVEPKKMSDDAEMADESPFLDSHRTMAT